MTNSMLARLVYCARGLGYTEPAGRRLCEAVDADMAQEWATAIGPMAHPKPRIKRNTERIRQWADGRWVCESERAGDYKITAHGLTPTHAFTRWLGCLCDVAASRVAQQRPGWLELESATEFFGSFLLDCDDMDFDLEAEA